MDSDVFVQQNRLRVNFYVRSSCLRLALAWQSPEAWRCDALAAFMGRPASSHNSVTGPKANIKKTRPAALKTGLARFS